MKIYLLIAKRFLFPRNDFRSNTINFISFIGLFIGAAAIVLSVSVLNGFQGILQTEAKKIYGDYLVEDISNASFFRELIIVADTGLLLLIPIIPHITI